MSIEDVVVDPVEPVVSDVVDPVDPVDPADGAESGEPGEPEPKEPEPDHKVNRAQKRIDKLTREKYELKGELEAYRRLHGGHNPAQSQQAQDARPTRDQFETDEEYSEAVIDYKVEQKLKGFESKVVQKQTHERISADWGGKVEAAKTAYPDWDDAMEDAETEVTPEIQRVIMSSDVGPDLLYHLAKNPKDAEKLGTMDPLSAARFLGNIEARIVSKKTNVKPVPVSKAPEPIKPVAGRGAVGEIDLDKLSPEAYAKARGYKT